MAEHQRIDAFELWCWRKLLRVPWTARRSNQSIIKEINPEYSLERLMMTEAPILWPPDAKSWLIRKVPDAGKDWRQEEKGTTEDEMVGWHHWLNGQEFWASSGRWWWTRKPGVLQSMGGKKLDMTEQLNNKSDPSVNRACLRSQNVAHQISSCSSGQGREVARRGNRKGLGYPFPTPKHSNFSDSQNAVGEPSHQTHLKSELKRLDT